MKQIDKDIKERKFKNAYLIYGEESYLVREYTNKLCDALVPGEAALMNMEVFDGRHCNANKIIQAGETAPFFNDYRVILVRGSGLFKEGRKADTTVVADAVKNVSEDCVYIFSDEDVDKRNSLYKAVDKVGYCCEIKTRDTGEISSWLIERSQGRLNASTAIYMVSNIGSDMTHLATELDKLLAYAGDKKITKSDIDTACTRSPELNIFLMVEAIGNRNADRALEIYNNMIFNGEEPLRILAMIARQFRLILQCTYMFKRKRYSTSEIARKLGFNKDFMVKKYLEQGSFFSMSKLIHAIDDCAKCDSDIKSSQIEPKLGTEMIILKYCKKI